MAVAGVQPGCASRDGTTCGRGMGWRCGLCGLCGDYSPWTASASACCSLCTSGSGIDPAEALPAGPGLLGRWAAATLVRERERQRQRERGRARGIRGHPPSDDGLDNLPDHTHTHTLPP